MQDLEKMREIQDLGWEDEDATPPEEPEGESSGGSWVPILQAVACLLALGGLLFLKYTGDPAYDTITAWYHQEAEAELQLPSLGDEAAQSSPSPAPSLSPSPSPAPPLLETDASVQRV